tara:strand:- start:8137 stop:8766 length:630 start_codon:yes stop_codon:yes gene_type:complete
MLKQMHEEQFYNEEKPMEYFREMVNSAVENLHVQADEEVIFYIVNLLSEFLTVDNLYTDIDPNADEEPLTLLLEKALNSDQNEQIQRFKHLGDFSLFISGFFSDSLYKRLVSLNYYKIIGCTSYNQLATIMKSKVQSNTFWELYYELAENFSVFVDILSEVSDKSFSHTNKDILKVYERWLKTKSLRDEKILKKEGIFPNASSASSYIQ